MPAFSKLLVANRGEISVRVQRTAQAMGYRTVAVYSDADEYMPHVQCADEAVYIGASPSRESYLRIDTIIEAARSVGADAIHPGYGFLSENPAFAKACNQAGIVWVGPPVNAIELMGSKRGAKNFMISAGVPCVPGYSGDDQSDERLTQEIAKIGYPVMLKASAGGGGRGMRLVTAAGELQESLRSARSEAKAAFGSDDLIVEKAIMRPRHIEIQVFGDSHGNAVYLFERDCSVQRRNQKVVEEAPSALLSEATRRKLGEAAVLAAKSCGYVGAGTCEFIVDEQENFYFLEMNTRLQVEHPVTELITGQDLVRWQLLVASGQPLPLQQHELTRKGHAIEIRLYAEDPRQGFLPQSGPVLRWAPQCLEGVRYDAGVHTGSTVTPFYDPMIAKVIAYGADRAEAIRRLTRSLQQSELYGLRNNREFLVEVINHPVFVEGRATTGFLASEFATNHTLRAPDYSAEDMHIGALCLAAHALLAEQSVRRQALAPYADLQIYHIITPQAANDKTTQRISVAYGRARANWPSLTVRTDSLSSDFQLLDVSDSQIRFRHGAVHHTVKYLRHGTTVYCNWQGRDLVFEDVTGAAPSASAAGGDGVLRAPMDGAVVAVLADVGARVAAGQTLIVVEAMKMEHPVKTAVAGTLTEVSIVKGTQVKGRQILAKVTPEP